MDYIHQQNCTLCDKPGWLVGGKDYNILRLTIDDTGEERCVILELRPHKCKEAKDAPD